MGKERINAIVITRQDRDLITIDLREIEDSIHTYYNLINCRSIDIVCRYFDNVQFDVVLDDEGLLKANETGELPTSWWQMEGYTPPYEGLFGVLVLTHHDEVGNLTSATFEDVLHVRNCVQNIPTPKGDLMILFHDVERR